MTKWRCNCNKIGCNCGCEVDIASPYAPARCIAFATKEPVWNRVPDKPEQKPEAELPKLTAEVFDRSDCPEWAMFAAVDKKGYVLVFDLEPECTHSSWYKRTRLGNRYELCNGYDSSDYEHSLVRRSEQKQESVTDCNQLPDWCKVGEWVWNKPAEEYVKITDISNGLITGKGVCDKIDYTEWHLSYYCEARLRPYNAEEMRGLVGKVLEHDGNASLVIVYLGNGLLRVGTKWVSAERLIEEGYTIDGKPCGKFEHLNDAGEWER